MCLGTAESGEAGGRFFLPYGAARFFRSAAEQFRGGVENARASERPEGERRMPAMV